MEEIKKTREGNFELLRVISMILIILHHYACHGGLMDVADAGINMWIGRNFKSKKFLKLVLQIVTYSVLVEFTYVYILKFEKQTTKYLSFYWFVNSYLSIYLISPFLNKMIKSFSKKSLEKLMILLLIIFNTYIDSDFAWLVYMYMIGAYIKLYNFEFKKVKMVKWYAIGTYAFIFLTMIVIHFLNKVGSTVDYRHFTGMQSVTALLASVFIFMWFKNLHIKNNKLISILGKASFAVYLIHDNEGNRVNFWWGIMDADKVYFLNPFKVFAHGIICVIVIYGFATICEIIRIKLIEEPLFKVKKLDKYFDKVDNWVND